MRVRLVILAAAMLAPMWLEPAAAQAAVANGTAGPGGSVLQAERQLQNARARLEALNNQVDRARATVAQLDRKLAQDRARQAALHSQLASIARFEYEQGGLSLMNVIEAGSLQQVLDEIGQVRLVGDRQSQLLSQINAITERDTKLRSEQAKALAQVKAARDQAARVAASAQTTYQADESAALQAQASTVARQASVVGYSGPPGRWPNHFDYGYCTWYVANRRYVPWFGNAIEWWPNARAYGYREGSTPRVGAIMVTSESSYGHVAYVEAVNPDGSWTVAEMDYVGWDVVDRRTIKPGQVPVVGFIY